MSAVAADRAGWSRRTSVSTGYDVFTQTYYLSTEDTTETIGEMEAVLDAEWRTVGRAIHDWRLRPRLSLGTERHRQQLDWDYAFRPDGGEARLRCGGGLTARQYAGSTDYSLNSDNREGGARLRWLPDLGGRVGGELQVRGSTLIYGEPSELEVDRREGIAAVYLTDGPLARRRWRVGLRGGRRAHPDTSAIDRTMTGLEFEYDHDAFLAPTFRVSQRSERRRIDDESVRPSSWEHWSELEASLPAGEARLTADLRVEIWRYDEALGAYRDQTRLGAATGVDGGGLDGPGWKLQLVMETLDSDDAEECYRQHGVRGAVDHFGRSLAVDLALEIGRRDYDDVAGVDHPLYTDFTYFEIWLSASWRIGENLSVDALANYVPERHDEDIEDQAMGFGNLRLTYRF